MELISTADFHLTEYRPSSRKDDYLLAQFNKLDYILSMVKERNCIWTHSGDLFDIPEPSLFFVRKVIKKLKQYGVKPYVIPGQHDLIKHSLKIVNRSALAVLDVADVINLIIDTEPIEIMRGVWLYGVPFGLEPIKPKTDGFNILLLHELIVENASEWPGQNVRNALKVLKEHKYDLILSGDNHKHFIKEYSGRLLVNIGPIMRNKKTYVSYKPKMFWTDFKDYEVLEIPHESDVFLLEEKHTDKNEDFSHSFVSLLNSDDTEVEESFLKNLEIFLSNNIVDKDVIKKIAEYTSEL